MGQIVHTSIIVFGCLAGLVAVLLALPTFRLREAMYRVGEWITQRNRDFP
jgi:ABC-type branched-subunit amino acid transport system permease subunit